MPRINTKFFSCNGFWLWVRVVGWKIIFLWAHFHKSDAQCAPSLCFYLLSFVIFGLLPFLAAEITSAELGLEMDSLSALHFSYKVIPLPCYCKLFHLLGNPILLEFYYHNSSHPKRSPILLRGAHDETSFLPLVRLQVHLGKLSNQQRYSFEKLLFLIEVKS